MKLKTLNNTQLCPQHQESYNTLPWFNTLDHTRKASFRTREEPGETIQNTVIYSAAKKKTRQILISQYQISTRILSILHIRSSPANV